MAYTKQTFSQTITYEDSDFYFQNLLLDMCNAEPTTTDVGQIIRKATVSMHMDIAFADIVLKNSQLLITYFYNTTDPANENHYNRGLTTEGVERVYSFFLTMPMGRQNKQLLKRVLDTFLDNLTRNVGDLSETVPSGKVIFYSGTQAVVLNEPFVTVEFSDSSTPNYITATVDILFSLRQKY